MSQEERATQIANLRNNIAWHEQNRQRSGSILSAEEIFYSKRRLAALEAEQQSTKDTNL